MIVSYGIGSLNITDEDVLKGVIRSALTQIETGKPLELA
jgi:hypothetical protein